MPLIAETGGINAMIVDATALPEQVIDDVVASAFRSAGQRCSALRLLCLQEDVAERMLDMLIGAARELKLGDPREPSTHVGPVIDADAKTKLDSWIAAMERAGRVRFRWDRDRALPDRRHLCGAGDHRTRPRRRSEGGSVRSGAARRALARGRARRAARRHRRRTAPRSRSASIRASISPIERIAARLANGNVYVNRNMIGAVVGTQPFGGTRLSGTGPKAGGPNYLRRFATEQVVTVNTAAAGGNAGLLAQDE